MKHRIASWAIAGFLIAGFWALYFHPSSSTGEPAWTLARVTCPIAFVAPHLRFGLHLSWVLLVNAATYALIGLTIEMFRKPLHQAT